MKCNRAEMLISHFCDSKQTANEEKQLFSHLDRCESCREVVWGVQKRLWGRSPVGEHNEDMRNQINRIASKVYENFYY